MTPAAYWLMVTILWPQGARVEFFPTSSLEACIFARDKINTKQDDILPVTVPRFARCEEII